MGVKDNGKLHKVCGRLWWVSSTTIETIYMSELSRLALWFKDITFWKRVLGGSWETLHNRYKIKWCQVINVQFQNKEWRVQKGSRCVLFYLTPSSASKCHFKEMGYGTASVMENSRTLMAGDSIAHCGKGAALSHFAMEAKGSLSHWARPLS